MRATYSRCRVFAIKVKYPHFTIQKQLVDIILQENVGEIQDRKLKSIENTKMKKKGDT